MSFGFSVSDIVLLCERAWETFKNAQKACGAHNDLTFEVSHVHTVLRRLEQEMSRTDTILHTEDDSDVKELGNIVRDAARLLGVLSQILKKYSILSVEEKSTTKLWKKIQFGNGEMQNLDEIRSKLSTNTSAITILLNLMSINSNGRIEHSQGRFEKEMQSHGKDLKAIRTSIHWITATMQADNKDSSVMTSYSHDDKACWRQLRRELINRGFSSAIISNHMSLIINYVMELGERGAFDTPPQVSGPALLSAELVEAEGRNSSSPEPSFERISQEQAGNKGRGHNLDPKNHGGTVPTQYESDASLRDEEESSQEQKVSFKYMAEDDFDTDIDQNGRKRWVSLRGCLTFVPKYKLRWHLRIEDINNLPTVWEPWITHMIQIHHEYERSYGPLYPIPKTDPRRRHPMKRTFFGDVKVMLGMLMEVALTGKANLEPDEYNPLHGCYTFGIGSHKCEWKSAIRKTFRKRVRMISVGACQNPRHPLPRMPYTGFVPPEALAASVLVRLRAKGTFDFVNDEIRFLPGPRRLDKEDIVTAAEAVIGEIVVASHLTARNGIYYQESVSEMHTADIAEFFLDWELYRRYYGARISVFELLCDTCLEDSRCSK